MQQIYDILMTARKNLIKHKMRSMLTSLGIIIGVSSVIMIASLSASAREVVKNMVYNYGNNTVRYYSNDKAHWADESDVKKIIDLYPQIRYISPFFDKTVYDVKYFSRILDKSRINACNNDFFAIKEFKLEKGRLFTYSEQLAGSKMAVIGATVKTRLFYDRNPINEIIMIENNPFRVIGVLQSSGSSLTGKDFDNIIAVPYLSWSASVMHESGYEQIYASVVETSQIEGLRQIFIRYFKSKFNLTNDIADIPFFTITTSQDKLEMANFITQALTYLMILVASIALFVGGVGIMNIMLATVNERIKEIGIRMAIGAKGMDILIQFLSESALLSSVGGVIGVFLGIILYLTITIVLEWPFIFSPFVIILSFIFSVSVGVFFGYYPAKKASLMKPIEALHRE